LWEEECPRRGMSDLTHRLIGTFFHSVIDQYHRTGGGEEEGMHLYKGN
jgi:hypothetical protein